MTVLSHISQSGDSIVLKHDALSCRLPYNFSAHRRNITRWSVGLEFAHHDITKGGFKVQRIIHGRRIALGLLCRY